MTKKTTYKRSTLMQERLDQNRETILTAATALFGEHGIQGTHIQHIADKAGLSHGLLYRYFGNKNDIVINVLNNAISIEIGILNAITQSHLSPDDKLYRAVRTFVKRALNRPKLAYALMLEPAGERVEKARFESKKLIKGALTQILDEGNRAGIFHFKDIGASSLCIVGAMTFAVIEPFSLNPNDINKDEFSTSIADFCLNAVCPTLSDGNV